jgi:hypothetical protein
MRFIGDVHGRIKDFTEILETRFKDELIFQLGDMGVGFPGETSLPKYPRERFLFIRGNHDNPEACLSHPNYAGDWGFIGDFFFLGGAWSIDWPWRRAQMAQGNPPIWWPDEELNQKELDRAITAYKKAKPKIVATHDGPLSVTLKVLLECGGGLSGGKQIKTRTGTALQEMFAFINRISGSLDTIIFLLRKE